MQQMHQQNTYIYQRQEIPSEVIIRCKHNCKQTLKGSDFKILHGIIMMTIPHNQTKKSS